MGIMFVLLFWGVIFGILGAAASLTLGFATRRLVRRVRSGSRRVTLFAFALPWICLVIGSLGFLTYAAINSTIFHRDIGIGDTWETPIPNGDQLTFIDVEDNGTLTNPKTQPSSSSLSSQDDAVFGIHQMQVDGNFVAGIHTPMTSSGTNQNADRYFLLDTVAEKYIDFTTSAELESQLKSHGLSLHLRPAWDVFCDYRNTWFDWLTLAVGGCVPFIGLGVLILLIVRARRSVDHSALTI